MSFFPDVGAQGRNARKEKLTEKAELVVVDMSVSQ
jgi:hypothetical protein